MERLFYLSIISMLPLIELRGGMIKGAIDGIDFTPNFIACVIGNLVPIIFLIPFAGRVLFWFSKLPKIGWMFKKIITSGQKKIDKLGKYELLGIFLFVAIPIPTTGAWTGALIATLLQIPFKQAFFTIALGVISSGLIMGIISYGFLEMLT